MAVNSQIVPMSDTFTRSTQQHFVIVPGFRNQEPEFTEVWGTWMGAVLSPQKEICYFVVVVVYIVVEVLSEHLHEDV